MAPTILKSALKMTLSFKNTKFGRKIFRHVVLPAFLSLQAGFGVVMWTIHFSVFYPYQRFVAVLAKHVSKQNLGAMLTGVDSIFADGVYAEKTANSVLLAVLTVNGTLSTTTVRTIIQRHVLTARLPNAAATLRYPQLQQYTTSFLGYWFWKDNPNFSVLDHIKVLYLSSVKTSETDITEIQNILLNRPFPKKRSPWDVTVVYTNDTTFEKTYLAIRAHHCLADGKSMVKLVAEGFGNQAVSSAPVAQAQQNLDKAYLQFYSLLPYYIFRYFYKVGLYRYLVASHPWRQQFYPYISFPVVAKTTRKFPLDKVRATSQRYNVCPSAVLMAAVSGLMVRLERHPYLKRFSMNGNDFPTLCSLPKPGHPATLANHFYAGPFLVPATPTTMKGRVQRCFKEYTLLKETHMDALSVELLWGSPGTYPHFFRSNLPYLDTFALCLSNIAGERSPISLRGNPVEEFIFSAATVQSSVGAFITVFSYKDQVRFTMVGSTNAMSEKECHQICALLEDEMRQLLL